MLLYYIMVCLQLTLMQAQQGIQQQQYAGMPRNPQPCELH